jgi:hypothetical protein
MSTVFNFSFQIFIAEILFAVIFIRLTQFNIMANEFATAVREACSEKSGLITKSE